MMRIVLTKLRDALKCGNSTPPEPDDDGIGCCVKALTVITRQAKGAVYRVAYKSYYSFNGSSTCKETFLSPCGSSALPPPYEIYARNR